MAYAEEGGAEQEMDLGADYVDPEEAIDIGERIGEAAADILPESADAEEWEAGAEEMGENVGEREPTGS